MQKISVGKEPKRKYGRKDTQTWQQRKKNKLKDC